ncbi:MAG: ribonuclease E/G [Rhizobiales bacterium 65-9]|nr:MAG: ribonuclease E/G [Rhizobiales bacterium 65-9]
MANNKMLIDSTHPEETRVVVTRGNRVEEFDFESASRKPLRGNIYLAKVTRVEPSLQAAFVEYGGNRHGFLAFSEIHPDYYQIPVADRQALIEAEERYEHDQQKRSESRRNRRDRVRGPAVKGEDDGREDRRSAESAAIGEIMPQDMDAAPATDAGDEAAASGDHGADASTSDEAAPRAAEASAPSADVEDRQEDDAPAQGADNHDSSSEDSPSEDSSSDDDEEEDEDDDEEEEDEDDEEEDDSVEQLGGDALEEAAERPRHVRRHYKIQEVIKRRQILLVQVAKEERGTKGAALTTYLSLAGRYSVLMPNTARGGGVSRKITSAQDRKRLKELVQDLEVPKGMGIILRTAGAARTKAEIKRDFEYLLRMWESVRELTLESSAPALVYEEGSLIKRSIRDLYSRDIDEIVVGGEEGYREAKDFMRMLMPSHARQVKYYREPTPLFARYGVESQLDAMFSNQVTLKSGGYLVINQAEALVAIDVNSGRSTREHNIEDTALKTNLEAAEEVARQLRLRDLAGLIVIDFIDMEERRNNRAVEKRLKDALKNDRARIQIGRISPFGLLEMSRQRLRTGVVESSSILCPHCGGSGHVRAPLSIALQILRILEDQLIRSNAFNLIVRAPTNVAIYLLNAKRAHLRAIEQRFGVSITINLDDHLGAGKTHLVEKGEMIPEGQRIVVQLAPPVIEPDEDDDIPIEEDEAENEEVRADESAADAESDSENGEAEGRDGGRRRRRRRRRGRGDQPNERETESDETQARTDSDDEAETDSDAEGDHEPERASEEGASDRKERGDDSRGRRRGRRGGRRDRRDRDERRPLAAEAEEVQGQLREPAIPPAAADLDLEASPAVTERAEAEQSSSDLFNVTSDRPAAVAEQAANDQVAPVAQETGAASVADAPVEPAKPARAPVTSNPDAYRINAEDPAAPKRGGWWAKAKKALGGE